MVKKLFGLGLQQVTGMLESLLKLSHLNWPTPDDSTLCRCQQRLQVYISYRANPNGLHLLVDSTGVKMLGGGEWKAQKHGAEYRRQWRKVHLAIDAETVERQYARSPSTKRNITRQAKVGSSYLEKMERLSSP